MLLLALVVLAPVLASAAPAEENAAATAVPRQYMYAFMVVGALLVVMLITTSYVTRLNIALRGEIKTRKVAEKELLESVQRFEHIVACSGDWIWETDKEGRYTYSSTMVKSMLGYEPEDVLGKTQEDLLTSGERERYKAKAEDTFANKERVFREKYRLVTRDGHVVIHESTAEPVVDNKGTLQGYRGVNRDVTSQVRFIRL